MVNMSNNRHVTNVVLFVHDPTDLKRTGDIIKMLHIQVTNQYRPLKWIKLYCPWWSLILSLWLILIGNRKITAYSSVQLATTEI